MAKKKYNKIEDEIQKQLELISMDQYYKRNKCP